MASILRSASQLRAATTLFKELQASKFGAQKWSGKAQWPQASVFSPHVGTREAAIIWPQTDGQGAAATGQNIP